MIQLSELGVKHISLLLTVPCVFVVKMPIQEDQSCL